MDEERISGKVAWYASERGFGVIAGSDQRDFFIHYTNLMPGQFLRKGLNVTFLARPRRRQPGLEAYAVKSAVAAMRQNAPQPDARETQTAAQSCVDLRQDPAPVNLGQSPWQAGQAVTTQVVGTTFQGRQRVVAQLDLGEDVLLVREPSNPFDHNAILVVRQGGDGVGYINRHLAAALAPYFDVCGQPVLATVVTLTAQSHIREVTVGFIVPAPAFQDNSVEVSAAG